MRPTPTRAVESDPTPVVPAELAEHYREPSDADVLDRLRTITYAGPAAEDIADARRQLVELAILRARAAKEQADTEQTHRDRMICAWCGTADASRLPVAVGPPSMIGHPGLGATPSPVVDVTIHPECRPPFQAALIARLAATVPPAAASTIDALVQQWSPSITTR